MNLVSGRERIGVNGSPCSWCSEVMDACGAELSQRSQRNVAIRINVLREIVPKVPQGA